MAVPRKVILDVDPGIDDAVALAMALFDPRLEVVAITAVAGNVKAEQATRNVQAIVEQLDPPRWPRIGAASPADRDPLVNSHNIFGEDGLGNAGFAVAELHNLHPSEKVISDALRAEPQQITIVALGPLTNVARALRRDPSLAEQVGQVVVMGGTFQGPGNVTPAAEFNMYCDPLAAQTVLNARLTTTLVPLDITSQVIMNFFFLDQLPTENCRAGKFLRKILPFAFRAYHQEFGVEGIHLHDAVALLAVTDPELFTTHGYPIDVETHGELTTGATIVDRRPNTAARRNAHVAIEIETELARTAIMQSIARAADATY